MKDRTIVSKEFNRAVFNVDALECFVIDAIKYDDTNDSILYLLRNIDIDTCNNIYKKVCDISDVLGDKFGNLINKIHRFNSIKC